MKISYNWLKSYLTFTESPEEISRILTDTGLEVEGLEKVETIKGGLSGVVIGHVLEKEKHPDADRLNITKVDIGGETPLQIVCGAPNVAAGQKVVVATVGCTLYPTPEEAFKIKKSKIRGVESFGMICAEDELGLGKSHDGIMVLPEDTEVGIPARDFFEVMDDYLIEIGLTPNRADAMGHIGVARDLKAYFNFHENRNLSLAIPETSKPIEAGGKSIQIQIEIQDTEKCPQYAGAIISGITVKDSPEWLQNYLKIIGLSPINNIVDITNFVLHETGNPLHAFDLEKVGDKIIIRTANKGEKLVTLDDVERELHAEDLLICNATEPMCLAGVFGGAESGVSTDTTSIFLEAAYFQPVAIRKAAKRHALNTDSSFRFERGVDPNNIINARDRAVDLILEVAGGQLEKRVNVDHKELNKQEVVFSFDRCRTLCGIELEDEEIVRLLAELDIHVVSDSEEEVVLSVPNYRVDVLREADVIEEVLRIYGFNKVPVPTKLNSSLAPRKKIDPEKIYNLSANFLVDNGFYEIMNNSLTSSSVWQQVQSKEFIAEKDVHLLNPLSNELDVMRQTLLFGGLKSLEHNHNRQQPDAKLFEFGNVYQKTEKGYQEGKRMSMWMTGRQEKENWNSRTEKSDFFVLKGAVEGVLNKLGIYKGARTTAIQHDLFSEGMTLSVMNKEIVHFGIVSPNVCKAHGVKKTVYAAEFNWDNVLSASVMNKVQFKPIPKTQFVRRDFSLLLDKHIPFDDIKAIAQKVDKKLLREIALFDVYEGKNLEKGKKSYAVSFKFQDDEKTLKDKQVDAIMDKIRKNLEGQLNAELR